MIESSPHRKAPRKPYAEVMDQCRDMAIIFSNAQLSELFEHAGTALLDFAEQAENNTMQSRFFEAMGLIQRRRADMEQTFRGEINQGFENFARLGTAAGGSDDDEESTEDPELSLVTQEDMEESVASENLIIKANSTFFPELFALSQRLAVVNGGRKLKDFEIPGGPHHLVQAFRQSMGALEVGVKIKVVLYALFGKFVVNQAKSLYDECNGSLKDAGILPNLKPVQIRPEHPRGQAASEAQQEQKEGADGPQMDPGPASLGAELFDTIVDLMSRRHGVRYGGERSRAAPATPAERAAAAAASRDLVTAVSKVQSTTTPEAVHAMVAEAAQVPNLEIDTAFVERVKDTLTQERQQVFSQIDRDKLSPMDSDLIDLIGMLFEYMLNDPILPNLAKALLSHLHTPYLKVALIDRRLLVDEHHAARQLLDKMVEAGNLWIDENNLERGIFPAMQRVVDRVLQEFSEDVALFEELLSTFEQAVSEQQRKTDTMEHRTQEAVRGREKLQLAKQRANRSIQQLLARTPLPQPVANFLHKTWLDHLVFILLRDKDEEHGSTWKQAQRTAEDLVSLFEPDATTGVLRKQTEMIPGLRKRITDAIKGMGSHSHSALDALFRLLDAPETWEEFCEKAAAAQQEKPEGQEAGKASPAGREAEESQEQVSAQQQEIIERLSKMKFGTWFEFISDTGAAPRRIKLSWLSALTSTCMFVDRSGMQAEIKTLKELAEEVLSGRAKVIPRPKHPFIERALVSIRKMLQVDEEEETPAEDTPPPQ